MNADYELTNGSQIDQPTGWKDSVSGVLRERAFFVIMTGVLLLLTLLLVWPFLSPILLALAAVVITKPIYDWYTERKWLRGSTKWAVAFTLVTSILLIAVPVLLFVGVAITQATSIVDGLSSDAGGVSLQELNEELTSLMARLSSESGVELTRESIAEWRAGFSSATTDWVTDFILAIGQAIPSLLVNSVITLAIMMVLLPIYRHPDRGNVAELVPFPSSITDLYLDKVQMTMRAMFLGTFVIAIVQGAAMGVVYWIAGVPNAVFLALLSMMLALLPVIGISLIAWPVAILLFLTGNTWQAIFVIFMLIVVVGNIDAVLRPKLVPKEAHLNAALTLLSVFGGIRLLGIVGLLYGPVIMILLVTSIEVYTKYILRSDLEPYMDDEGTLSLEKLGLRSSEDDADEESSGLAGTVSRTLKGLWSGSGGSEAVNDADVVD